MIKIFLVEDEVVLRRYIRDGINWNENGFELVGEAGDGEYAYPFILKTKPDILLTDIRMPFMDGLQLSHLVRKELPHTKIILLSGYDEFNYAKEGIKLGISDYLLKPITADKLIEALKKVADTIYDEKERNRLLERYFISDEKYTEFLDHTDYCGVDRQLVSGFLKLGSKDECKIFIDEYFGAMGEHNYRSLLLRQYITMDIFFVIREFLRSLNVKTEEAPDIVKDLKQIPQAINTLESTKRYLYNLFKAALSLRDSISSDRYSGLIESAKKYIEEHYADNNISLSSIAAHTGVSSNYFSSIFKQETGQTFVEYLMKTRIDKACELLKCTSLRTSEIGEKVGYNDPHYFSATFKKVMGESPKSYKNSYRPLREQGYGY